MSQGHQGRPDLLRRQPVKHEGIVRVRAVRGDNFPWRCGHRGWKTHTSITRRAAENKLRAEKFVEMEKGRPPRRSVGTRRASLPIIGAAQERATRGKKAQPRMFRSVVTLLAACPQESGATALILARFYLFTSCRRVARRIWPGTFGRAGSCLRLCAGWRALSIVRIGYDGGLEFA